MTGPLRLMIYDRTNGGRGVHSGLALSWRVGARLYGGVGRLDAWFGASTWEEGLRWLGTHEGDQPIGEIQFWGHGRWGNARVGVEVLDASVLDPGHLHHEALRRIRARLLPDGRSLWWWRTCETYGAVRGQAFARAWTDFLGARTAGHTHIIGPFQSGLHALRPGEVPGWSPDEGIVEGTATAPLRARWSRPGLPRTITCLHGRLPGWA